MLNHAPTELLRLDDLAVLVETAVRAHAMRKLSLAALRADGTGRGCDFVVSGTTGMSAGAAHFYLGTAMIYLLALCRARWALARSLGKHAR